MPRNSKQIQTDLFEPADEDTQLALGAKVAIKEVLKLFDEQVSFSLKRILLDHLIWQITVAYGKYLTQFRSKGVVDDEDRQLVEHDHVHPRSGLISELLKQEIRAQLLSGDDSGTDAILRKAIGCVVTRAEHKLLNKQDDALEGWARYTRARIAVRDMSSAEEKWKVTEAGDVLEDL